ncbi:DNA-directed RNA polymerase I subunit RPA49-like [Saccoglossus kowalevskii]|uniref:DNA-directed RNA polymerase I subunit RPA49-like n=1 Tax=Saccoglossus kowalevskii TaxID=10224 RepID=A0ABM0LXG8_SACKO|nr:PREDICTED: DNA-directed RNA polymerase I subunit RPA49-like [Saccoglossus kowalevskii]
MAASMEYMPSGDEPQKEAVLAHFTNGRLNIDEDGTCTKAPKFGYYCNKNFHDPRDKNKRILVGETDKMDYVGYNYGLKASQSNALCKYMVGVLDKKTGKMKVYDAQYFIVRPKLDNEEDDVEEKPELSFIEKNDILTKAFGSSKKKRAVESRLNSKLEVDALGQSMETAVQQAKAQSQQITRIPGDQEAESVIPPFDAKATKPEDVYKLQDIISDTQMESLKVLATELISSTENQKSESKHLLYISHHLYNCLPTDQLRKETMACQLLYLHYLVILYHTKARSLQRKSIFPDETPAFIASSLLEIFTCEAISPDSEHKTIRYMSARLKDRLLSYILVLCLHIDRFNMNLDLLQKDLKIPKKKLLVYVNSLGCKVARARTPQDPQRVTLPIPLTFPEKARQRKRKK